MDNIYIKVRNRVFRQTIGIPMGTDCAPATIELKRTTEIDSRLSYLDLEVKIKDRKFSTAVFDKRDDFNFHIVNFPHMDSNIPTKPAYRVYIS